MKNLLIALAILLIGGLVYLVYSSNKRTEPLPTAEEQIEKDFDSIRPVSMYNVTTASVNYFEEVTGYFAEPDTDGTFPGVVMIHEWWGLNENIENMAEQLAAEGYRVLAVDLFGKVALTPDEARQQTSELDQEQALENMQAAYNYLVSKGSSSVGSLGWCFGGGQSLQLALSEQLDATVIYYGNLVTDPEQLVRLEEPILGIFGREDQSIPVEEVENFKNALNVQNVENEIYIYDDVGHAFANPSNDNFAPVATEDAWIRTLSFLANNLKK